MKNLFLADLRVQLRTSFFQRNKANSGNGGAIYNDGCSGPSPSVPLLWHLHSPAPAVV
jgi:predicted outer membrane repeat protein